MSTIVALRTEVPHQFVFELRYQFGQAYWDTAGRVSRRILQENEGWDFVEIGLSGCRLQKKDQNLQLTYSTDKIHLSQTQSAEASSLLAPGEFGKLAESIASNVVDALDLTAFTRLGFRSWLLYPTADREGSYAVMARLKQFPIGPALLALGPSLKQASFSAVIDREQHMVRTAIAPFEQNVVLSESTIRAAKTKASKESHQQRMKMIDRLKAQKLIASFPQFGVLLDFDAYIDDPPYPDGISISDFIMNSHTDFDKLKNIILEST